MVEWVLTNPGVFYAGVVTTIGSLLALWLQVEKAAKNKLEIERLEREKKRLLEGGPLVQKATKEETEKYAPPLMRLVQMYGPIEVLVLAFSLAALIFWAC